jgi:hypothetical protein
VIWPLHVANAIYLVSYAVKEILWLRLLTVLAGVSTLLAMSQMQPGPARAAVIWQLVFFAINFSRLVQLIYERRPVRLGPDARKLAAVFRNLRPRDLLRLLAVGEVVVHPPGDTVIRRGQTLEHLALVIDGNARVELATAGVVELSHGAFIGELGYLTGRPPAADVTAASSLRVVRWSSERLRTFLETHPETRTAVQLVLGADLAAKLRGR